MSFDLNKLLNPKLLKTILQSSEALKNGGENKMGKEELQEVLAGLKKARAEVRKRVEEEKKQ